MAKKIIILLIINVLCNTINTFSQQESNPSDQIIGKWMSAANDLKVEVYKENGIYRAKVIWFACLPNVSMNQFYDTENPNPALRSRPWLGLQILDGLQYYNGLEWNKGKVYDPNTGHTFSSVCRLESQNTLKVRGYWLYEWIGKNLIFYRV